MRSLRPCKFALVFAAAVVDISGGVPAQPLDLVSVPKIGTHRTCRLRPNGIFGARASLNSLIIRMVEARWSVAANELKEAAMAVWPHRRLHSPCAFPPCMVRRQKRTRA